jgi:hypothetical protein
MFFASEWIIKQEGIRDIYELYDAAADLDCAIWHRSFFTTEGYRGAQFIIRIPSLSVLELFVKNVNHLPFKNWKQIELEAAILTLDKPVRISQWSGNNQSHLEEGFYDAAFYNEALMKRDVS